MLYREGTVPGFPCRPNKPVLPSVDIVDSVDKGSETGVAEEFYQFNRCGGRVVL